MSTMRCKYCGDVYVYDVRSNGYSEDHCTITCAHADRVTKLQAENERLKAELADSLPLEKVREAFEYCTEQIEKWEDFSALDCQNCNHTSLCSVFGDAYLWEIKKLEKPDNL